MFSKILATGSYLPQQIRTNADLEQMVDTTDEWISVRTGIKQRRIARADETVASMGTEAAKKCFEMAGDLDVNEIDLIFGCHHKLIPCLSKFRLHDPKSVRDSRCDRV